jgi:hypothetical protein
MEGPSDHLLAKIQSLAEVEIALLLCLISNEHCIIRTKPQLLDKLGQELELVNILLFRALKACPDSIGLCERLRHPTCSGELFREDVAGGIRSIATRGRRRTAIFSNYKNHF